MTSQLKVESRIDQAETAWGQGCQVVWNSWFYLRLQGGSQEPNERRFLTCSCSASRIYKNRSLFSLACKSAHLSSALKPVSSPETQAIISETPGKTHQGYIHFFSSAKLSHLRDLESRLQQTTNENLQLMTMFSLPQKISIFALVSSMRIVLGSLYLLISYCEKFSPWICRFKVH